MRWCTGVLAVAVTTAGVTGRAVGAERKGVIKVPLGELLKLIPAPPPPRAKPPPYGAGLSSGDITVTVEADPQGRPQRGRVTARYALAVPDDAWRRLPILGTSASLLSATLDGRKATVAVHGSWYTLLTRQAGAHTLEFSFVVPVTTARDVSTLRLPLAPSAGTTLKVVVPGDQKVTIEPSAGVVRTVTHPPNVQTTATTPLPSLSGSEGVRVTWQRAVPAEAALPAKVYAEVHRLAAVAERSVRVLAICRYSILHAGVDRLSLTVPGDVEVVRVTGGRLAGWDVTRADGAQRVAVRLRYRATGDYLLALELERAITPDDERVIVPTVMAEGVERQSGDVACEAWSNVELGAVNGRAAGLDPRRVSRILRSAATTPIIVAFRPAKPDDEVVLHLRRHAALGGLGAVIDVADFETLVTADGRRLTRVIYAVRNRSTQFLRVRLPKGAILWTASVAGRPVKPATDGRGGVLFPLAKPTTQRRTLRPFPVSFVCFQPGTPLARKGEETVRVDLPTAALPARYASCHLRLPQGYDFDAKRFAGPLDHRNVLYQETEILLHPVTEAVLGAPYVASLRPVFDEGVVGYPSTALTGIDIGLALREPGAQQSGIAGKVTDVRREGNQVFAQLSVGSTSGVKKGTRFILYGPGQYKGDLVVAKVYPETSIGSLTTRGAKDLIAGDRATTRLGPVPRAETGVAISRTVQAGELERAKIDPRQSRQELLRNWAKAYGKGGAMEGLYQKMMFAQVYNLRDASVLPDGTPRPWPDLGADRQAISEREIARQRQPKLGKVPIVKSLFRTKVQRERFILRTKQEFDKAQAQMRARKFKEALAGLNGLLRQINVSGLPEGDVKEYRIAAERLRQQCLFGIEREDEAKRERVIEKAAVRQKMAREPFSTIRAEKVKQLVAQGNAHVRRREYGLASKVAEEALKLDPSNVEAKIVRDQAQMWAMHVRNEELRKKRDQEIRDLIIDVQVTRIPYRDLITYPKDWDKFSERREKFSVMDLGKRETPAVAQVRRQLAKPVTIEFPGTSFQNAIDHLQDLTGVNIVVDQKASEAEGITADTTIKLKLTNVRLASALGLILDQVNLGYVIKGETVFITSLAGLGEDVKVRMYDVRDLLVAMGEHGEDEGGGNGGNGGGWGNGDDDGGWNGDDADELLEADMSDLIQSVVAPEAWVAAEGTWAAPRARRPAAVEIDIPQIGQLFKFERFLVGEEPLYIEAPYVRRKD